MKKVKEMTRVTIDIADEYADVITMTFIGSNVGITKTTTNVAVCAHGLSEGTHFVVDESGHITQLKEDE